MCEISKTLRCQILGERHKDMIGLSFSLSPNEVLALWYDLGVGYGSVKHWWKGGYLPPNPLPMTPPPHSGVLTKLINLI